jgi:hypothetical protein
MATRKTWGFVPRVASSRTRSKGMHAVSQPLQPTSDAGETTWTSASLAAEAACRYPA